MNSALATNASYGQSQARPNPGVRFGFVGAILLILLTAVPVSAQEEAVDLSDVTLARFDSAQLADLDAYIADTLVQYGGSGASVAIVQNGEIVYSKGFGVTEQGGGLPVHGDTQFMIASVVKSMTALMIGTLVEQGTLTWDTPIIDVLPGFKLSDPVATARVTFRDLLSMRSGLPVLDTPSLFSPASPEQIVESLAELPLTAPIGESYHYSNRGYATAGFIGAIAAGGEYGRNVYETYTGLMQDRLFDPVGMTRTTFDFSAPIATKNRAAPIGIDLRSGTFAPIPFELEQGAFATTPSGGGWSTADDLAKYLMLQMSGGVTSGGVRIISEAVLEETWKPHIPMSAAESFCLGWNVSDFHGQRALSYGGGMLGYTSRVQFMPDAGLGVVILTNRTLSPMPKAVGDYVYELAFGLDHTAGAFVAEFNTQITGALAHMTRMLQGGSASGAAIAAPLGHYQQGIAVRLNQANEVVLATEYGDFPIDPVAGQPGFYLIRNVALLGVQFAENGEGLVTMTINSTFGDSQLPFVVSRLS